ncbi:MAG TPA: methionyl-tRNA formyltransferase [Terriglobia bacterium]|nr:methionyl-tRNA formyltransferase [Terriglobia bacterium]
MRLIFCGTPEFAVPTLEKLIAEKFDVELVVTNPDEPAGRGYEMKAPPVKMAAEKAGLEVFQPARLKDSAAQEYLSKFRPDAMVVVAYGHIIPPWMIALPRLGCINLHGSLLPKYRGAAPIPWAIVRGEQKTGVTTMKIDAGLDTGDMLLEREVEIGEDDTTPSLSLKLSTVGAGLMVETLHGLECGEIIPRPQDSSKATLAPLLKKEDGVIDWTGRAEEIARRVRGFQPWPGAYTTFRGKKLHLWAAKPSTTPAPAGSEPSTLEAQGGELFIVCGDGTRLQVKELQLEGRKRVTARDFLNGVHLQPGEKAF